MICSSKPYELNITKLSQRIGINRTTLYQYIHYLSMANLLYSLKANTKGDSIFVKPSKLYLGNANMSHVYCQNHEVGTVREQFFINMFTPNHTLSYPAKGDFLVDDTYTFEVGGKNKSFEQIKDVKQSYIVADDIEVGYGKKIPLWLFGMMY